MNQEYTLIYYLKKILISVYWRLKLKKFYAYIYVSYRYFTRVSSIAPNLGLRKQRNIALVVMIKSEENYIRHWVRFHSLVGISNFYIYINENSTESVKKYSNLLANIPNTNIYLINWKDTKFPTRVGGARNKSRFLPSMQELMYMHWRLKFGGKFNYMMRTDIDEYVYRNDWRSGNSDVNELLPKNGLLRIVGYNFGSNGLKHYSSEPTPMRFSLRSSNKIWNKSISHIKSTKEIFNAHISAPDVNASDSSSLILRINHYRIRSYDEFLQKKIHLVGLLGGDYVVSDFKDLDDESSSIKDYDLINYLQQLDSSFDYLTDEFYSK